MTYPLDPLSADEFTAVAAILQREHRVGAGAGGPATSDLGWRIVSIELVEPTKTELADFDGGGPTPARRAEVTCLQRANNATYKGVLSLTDDRIEAFEQIPGVQANFTVDEFLECDELVRSHPDVIAALAKRGITDMDLVFMDTWTYSDAIAPPEYRDRRLGWSDTRHKEGPGQNPYAHPVSGLHCVVDLKTMEVLRVQDNGGVDEPNVMGGPDNPYGLSLVLRDVALPAEDEGKQDVSFATQRCWKVVNTNVVNGLGTHPSYKLAPSGAIPMKFDPASAVFQRANVIGHTLWVTPNHPDERWPAGEFVNQSSKDTGLAEWTKVNRNIENTDVVLWYVLGIHHITRPEDWPVMPVDVMSFWLKPYGFFDRNPALDVVGTPPDTCHMDSTSVGH